jgi:hypothetical protein
MITPPKYTVMGENGQEYGPVYAEQILDWIKEGRLEKKTPVKPADAKDWVFLEMLPEFTAAFETAPPPEKPKARAKKVSAGIFLVLVVILLTAAVIFLLVKNINPH